MASVATNIAPGPAEPWADRMARAMEGFARMSPTFRRVEALSAIPDGELEARGTTRAEAAAQIFGSRLYI